MCDKLQGVFHKTFDQEEHNGHKYLAFQPNLSRETI